MKQVRSVKWKLYNRTTYSKVHLAYNNTNSILNDTLCGLDIPLSYLGNDIYTDTEDTSICQVCRSNYLGKRVY